MTTPAPALPETVVALPPRTPTHTWSRTPGGYDIRPPRTHFQQNAVSRLVHRMYAWRGYSIQSSGYPADDPNRITLAVWEDEDVVATLTIGLDSADGLLADALYAQELSGLRRPGRRVCEVTRLAVHPQHSSGRILNALFRTALLYGKEHFQASDAVIEVNPRHVRFYEHRFGFRQVGTLRQCPRVNAPAVLLHQALGRLTVFGARTEEPHAAWAEVGELAAAG